jgi:hypothetical protein
MVSVPPPSRWRPGCQCLRPRDLTEPVIEGALAEAQGGCARRLLGEAVDADVRTELRRQILAQRINTPSQ